MCTLCREMPCDRHRPEICLAAHCLWLSHDTEHLDIQFVAALSCLKNITPDMLLQDLTPSKSARPRGARPGATGWVTILNQFQSTRPRGARPTGTMGERAVDGFNPRARAGRDYVVLPINISFPGFNPRARAGRDSPRRQQ